jgi:hypothetical protein
MHHGSVPILLLALLAVPACQREAAPPPEPKLSAAEQAAKDRTECQALATQQSGFDPLTAEEPARTISSTHRRGGETLGSGAVVEGAAKGAVAGVIGGAIMGSPGKGAGAGAAVGGLIGGVRRHKETNEMVTSTRTNPDYTAFVASRKDFKTSFEGCLAQRKAAHAADAAPAGAAQ